MERGLQRVNHQEHLEERSWRVEVCRKSGQRVSEVYQAAVSENEVCFAEVSVRPAAAETAASIECGELRVDIHTGADPETIQAIIRALKSC